MFEMVLKYIFNDFSLLCYEMMINLFVYNFHSPHGNLGMIHMWRSRKVVQFSRSHPPPPTPLFIYIQNSSTPLDLDAQFQTNRPSLQMITNQLKENMFGPIFCNNNKKKHWKSRTVATIPPPPSPLPLRPITSHFFPTSHPTLLKKNVICVSPLTKFTEKLFQLRKEILMKCSD